MSSMADFMSDLTSSVQGGSKNTSSGSTTGHAETSGVLSSLFGSPSVDVSGSYNHSSVSDFMQELKQHAQSSHHRVEEGTRAASSISIGEVSTRTHAEGETQDQYEASSREFSNQNRCHAVTYLFYRVNKRQRVRITLEAIERRVRDAAAPTHLDNNRFLSSGGVSAVPTAILATSADRLEVEARARASVAAAGGTAAGGAAFGAGAQTLGAQSILPVSFVAAQPLPAAVREAAVRQVDGELAKAGLITAAGGQVTEKIRAQFLIETDSSLPTPGVIVRGCLDECDVCEPARKREVELELEHAELENQLLKRQIEIGRAHV